MIDWQIVHMVAGYAVLGAIVAVTLWPTSRR